MAGKLEESAFPNSFVDDDMFALDDSLSLSPIPLEQRCNPIEDHLIKQLTNVEDRIETTKNDIADVQDTTKRILRSLQKAACGEHSSSDSDDDLYTVEGEPVVKKKGKTASSGFSGLELKSGWQRVIGDKWIIGAVLRNKSRQTLYNPRIYIHVKGTVETQGRYSFWQLIHAHWHRIEVIEPSKDTIVATIVLDVPSFRDFNFIETFGTIVYNMDDRVLQTAVPVDVLSAMDTISSIAVNFMEDKSESILALKILSEERTLMIKERNAEQCLLAFLQRLYFAEVAPRVYVVRRSGSLYFCMAEIFPPDTFDAVSARISARSLTQLNVMLRLLLDEFPEVRIEEENDKCIGAAKALLEELEAYLNDKSPSEIQRSRIRSDLLIP